MPKILIIEDSPESRTLMRITLEKKGYTVVEAENGKTGLEKAAAEQPDLIILDIIMPELDGYSLVEELTKDEKISKIPIILSTGRGTFKDLFELKGINLAGFIEKPFILKDLLEKVKAAIG